MFCDLINSLLFYLILRKKKYNFKTLPLTMFLMLLLKIIFWETLGIESVENHCRNKLSPEMLKIN